MEIIAITEPEFLPREAEAIVSLLDAGAWRVHVRKPGADAASVSALLEAVPKRYLSRISLHDCHELAVRYGLGGVHLNSRNPLTPDGFGGLVSRSCHSFEEISEYSSSCDYLFLSPVFDSISKEGYTSRFSLDEIRSRSGAGYSRVFALGGVCPDNVGLLEEAGFGGAAVLGYLWGPFRHDADPEGVLHRFMDLV